MRLTRVIVVVDSHTAGEPTRVVTGGWPPLPGASLREKRLYLSQRQDELRRFLMHEPRGHADMFGAIITDPVSAEADCGVIFMDNQGYMDMCGHGTIGVVTVLLETGMLDKEEVVLETPAGLVSARAEADRDGVRAVTFRNVASFFHSEHEIDVKGLGWVNLDIVYGGNYFAILGADQLGLDICLDNVDELSRLGVAILETANEQVRLKDPATGQPSRIALVEFSDEARRPVRNLVVFGLGQVDRSPCGTGTSAKMALLHAKGELKVGEAFRHQSVIGTEFTGRIAAETLVAGRPAILPEITGSAYITAFNHLVLDQNDPFPAGFRLS